eukprot:2675048-Pleurochrysis_carterae.AAC.2
MRKRTCTRAQRTAAHSALSSFSETSLAFIAPSFSESLNLFLLSAAGPRGQLLSRFHARTKRKNRQWSAADSGKRRVRAVLYARNLLACTIAEVCCQAHARSGLLLLVHACLPRLLGLCILKHQLSCLCAHFSTGVGRTSARAHPRSTAPASEGAMPAPNPTPYLNPGAWMMFDVYSQLTFILVHGIQPDVYSPYQGLGCRI